MIELLKQEIGIQGDKFQILPVKRLKSLKTEIDDFKNQQNLNGFQKFITTNLYQFETPAVDFEIRSVLIIASPTPSYAQVIFHWQRQEIPVLCPARSYPGKIDAPTATKEYLSKFLKSAGYHIESTPLLPLKRLAVRSGLAFYGRNNICYIEGMGSFFTLVSYFTDIASADETWHEIRQMDSCRNCSVCLKSCPTGAILKDRFLIDNERCLSYFNEGPGDFPEWLPKSAHHCLYDCLKCQNICPQNKDYITHVIGPIEFDEAETNMLLSGKSMQEFSLPMQKKVKFLGMDEWIGAIPRNMRVLFEKM